MIHNFMNVCDIQANQPSRNLDFKTVDKIPKLTTVCLPYPKGLVKKIQNNMKSI